jgi:hypothetical protein
LTANHAKTVRVRFLLLSFLVAALLLGAWGNVLGAAFCPTFALANRSSGKQLAHRPVSHAKMCDMGTGDMQMDWMAESAVDESAINLHIDIARESTADSDTLDQPMGLCTHCLMHSQAGSGAVSVGAIDPEKRSDETKAPSSALVSLLPVIVTSVRETGHAPPGESPPRNVLNSVFRI